MLNLHTFLILSLISFSFQDKNCLITFRDCISTSSEPDDGTEFESTIDNCLFSTGGDTENELCLVCKSGYAISYDSKRCKPFKNCYYLEAGDNKCQLCLRYFHPNSEGQCVRTLCDIYDIDGEGNEYCQKCFDGYYLNNKKECIKIPIPYCKQYDAATDKCTECLDEDVANEDGKCKEHAFIEGCITYTNGKCTECESNNYTLKDDTCQFNNCRSGQRLVEYCGFCQIGYDEDDGICVGYDGSKDTSSSSSENNKVEFALMIFILALLL